jgi:predicted component of type VI protein secretion system
MDVRLFITSKNDGQQQQITLSDPKQFVLGRGSSSVALLDGPGISREHVAVSVDRSQIFVSDVSVNGTWINGARLPQQQKRRLEPSDVVEIPGYEFAFQIDNESQQEDHESDSLRLQHEAPTIPAPSRELAPAHSFTLLDHLIIALAVISILVSVYYVVFL